MKYLVKSLALATAISAVLSGAAFAADDDIDILVAPESSFVEFGSGWYLRGDITASVNGHRYTQDYSDGTSEIDSEFRDMIGYGIGAGYRFTNNLRADITLGHYLSGNSEATYAIDSTNCLGWREDPSTGGIVDTFIRNCSGYDVAEYDTFALMGTGYFDLSPIGGFQPYVGAGVGVARVRWNEVTGGVICAPDAGAFREGCVGRNGDQPGANEVYRSGGVIAGGVDYRLAYSLTAGFAYRLKKNLLLDASYKYMGVGDSMGIATGSAKAQSTAKDGFSLHQINVGLRYEIW